MNLATPILICHPSEDFRSLLREMLTKNGFFHVLEASSAEELLPLLKHDKKSQFLILQGALIDEQMTKELRERNFLVLVKTDDSMSMGLAAKFGVIRLLSFPFSSQNLFEKIRSLTS